MEQSNHPESGKHDSETFLDNILNFFEQGQVESGSVELQGDKKKGEI
jgi:hypothetical protein